MFKVKFRRVMSVLLAAAAIMTALPVQAQENHYSDSVNEHMILPLEEVPGYQPLTEEVLGSNVALNAPVTKENVVALLEEYDPEGAYIIKDSINHGEDITVWWYDGESILDSLETAVHEEMHRYTWNHGTWGWDYTIDGFYLGNGQTVNVRQTKVYPSVEMAQTIPQELRTFRYDTYVGNPDPYMASSQDGAYGLLNEFTAYYWGAHNAERMYQYLIDNNASSEDWNLHFNLYGNGWVAYAEFKYYIIKYLDYAKTYYPDVYEGIIGNSEFVTVYNTIENLYAKQNQITIARMKEVGNSMGMEYLYEFYIGDYNILTKELEKPEYQAVIKDLGGTSASKTYTDVEAEKWYYDAVKYVSDHGIMTGVNDNEFQPNAPLTRGMFATMLYRMSGQPTVTFTNNYSDVYPGNWYSNAVIWASNQGIVSGYGNGRFGTSDYITREQIAKMLYEYGETKGYNVNQRADFDNFADASSVSGWAGDYMSWAVGSSMIGGKNIDGKLCLEPKGNATRAESATMLMRFMEKYN